MDFVVVGSGQNDVSLDQKLKPGPLLEPVNTNDTYMQEMGRFAVMEYSQGLCGVRLTFIRVVSSENAIVPMEGKIYSLVVEVEEQAVLQCRLPPSIKFYMANVLDKQCDKSWKLLSFVQLPWFPDPLPGPVIRDA